MIDSGWFKPSRFQMPVCKRIFSCGIFALMAALLSGAPAIFIQSYAWVYMATSTGGSTSLTRLVFEEPPCRYCTMAEEINQQSNSQEGVPVPAGQLAALNLVTILTESFDLLPPRQGEGKSLKWHENGVLDPVGQVHAPPTPPPRAS